MRFKSVIMMMVVLLFVATSSAWGQQWQESPEVSALFENEEVNGTFVVYDLKNQKLVGHNQGRAEMRYIPASTFKIPNTLIGLSTGAVSGIDEIFRYNGKPQYLKSWEKDMDLREAMKVSNVTVYKELARRIGLERMREEMQRMGYGNGDIGDAVDSFWLNGPLKISAAEQVLFLSRLAKGELPQSQEFQKEVREILFIESGDDWSLYAKTGLSLRSRPGVGWWVGWVEKGDEVYPFAINININDSDLDNPKRTELARAALKTLGLID